MHRWPVAQTGGREAVVSGGRWAVAAPGSSGPRSRFRDGAVGRAAFEWAGVATRVHCSVEHPQTRRERKGMNLEGAQDLGWRLPGHQAQRTGVPDGRPCAPERAAASRPQPGARRAHPRGRQAEADVPGRDSQGRRELVGQRDRGGTSLRMATHQRPRGRRGRSGRPRGRSRAADGSGGPAPRLGVRPEDPADCWPARLPL